MGIMKSFQIATAPQGGFHAKTRTNLSVNHLFGAAEFARDLTAHYKPHENEAWGESQFYDRQLALATAIVMMSVSAVEGYVAALYVDRSEALEGQERIVWDIVTTAFEKSPTIDKANGFLTARGLQNLDPGRQPVQDLKLLIDLRNALVHFKPEWYSEQTTHAKLSIRLEKRLKKLKQLAGDNGIFPRAWATIECGAWAVETATHSIEMIAANAKIRSPFDHRGFKDRLKTS